MVDYAGIIKSSIAMHDVVARYTGQQIVRGRIKCPIHHGEDRNMRVYPKSYYCWVCHASGDVIQFVQSVLGLSFQDAMRRLNEDFNLHLPIGAERSEVDDAKLSELDRKNRIRMLQEQLERVDYDLNCIHQANLAGLLNAVEIICQCDAPETPWYEWKPVWCMAMRLRTELRNELL